MLEVAYFAILGFGFWDVLFCGLVRVLGCWYFTGRISYAFADLGFPGLGCYFGFSGFGFL